MMNHYSVRGVLKADRLVEGQTVFEERIILCQAMTEDDAFAKAEVSFNEYATDSNFELVGELQLYCVETEKVNDGDEVFSLLRKSTLDSADYFNHFFATGDELERYCDQSNDTKKPTE